MKSRKKSMIVLSIFILLTFILTFNSSISDRKVNAENLKIDDIFELQLPNPSENSKYSNIKFNSDGSFTLASKSDVPKFAEGAVSYGMLTSPVIKTNKDFNGAIVKLTKKGINEETTIDIRASKDGKTWTQWYAAHFGDNEEIKFQNSYNYIQYSIILVGFDMANLPEVKNISIKLKSATSNDKINNINSVQTINQLISQTKSIDSNISMQQFSVSNPFQVNCYATREGLIGSTTANGHVIKASDVFVALPSKTSLNRNDTVYDYTVNITYNGRTITNIPVWDIGPYNEYDDYWNVTGLRDKFGYSVYPDLPRGTSEEYSAYNMSFHDGWTSSHRIAGSVLSYNSSGDPGTQVHNYLSNPIYPSSLRNNGAEIDLSDGLWNQLGLSDNTLVSVTFNWVQN